MKKINTKRICLFGGIAILLVVAVIGIFVIKNIRENYDEWRVISSVERYSSISVDVTSITKGEHISPLLKETLSKYAGQDVLFRVIVQFPYMKEFSEEFVVPKEEQAKYDKLLDEQEKLYGEYYRLRSKIAMDKSHGATDEELAELESQLQTAEAAWRAKQKEYEDYGRHIYNNFEIPYAQSRINQEIDYVKSLGVLSMGEFGDHSDVTPYAFSYGTPYIMMVTEEMIEKMTERGNCVLMLAPPERHDGYDIRITDVLTNYLDKMEDEDTIEVAIVCVTDKYNRYVGDYQGEIHSEYNQHLYEPFSAKKEIPKDIKTTEIYEVLGKEYVAQVVERNGLTERLVFDYKYIGTGSVSEYDPLKTAQYEEEFSAGFNAKLTKSEILALAKDLDIKAIYVVNATGAEFISMHND